jgi:predicted nucleic acid-binding protein
MSKYYAVIDTNVIVSALIKADSIPGMLLELVFSGMVIPIKMMMRKLTSDELPDPKDVVFYEVTLTGRDE